MLHYLIYALISCLLPLLATSGVVLLLAWKNRDRITRIQTPNGFVVDFDKQTP